MSVLSETINLPGSRTIEIQIPAGERDPLAYVLTLEQVQAEIRSIAKSAMPMLHYRHGNDIVGEENAKEALDALLMSGDVSDAEGIIDGWIDEDDYYRGLMADPSGKTSLGGEWASFADGLHAALERACGDDAPSKIEVRALFEGEALDALAEADTTGPLDQLERALDLGIVYIAGRETGFGVDDLSIVCSAGLGELNPMTVWPDENFARFLRMANVSSVDYKRAVAETYGTDLTCQVAPDGDPDFKKDMMTRLSREWRDLDVPADPARPAMLDFMQVFEILEMANYGGVVVAFGLVRPNDVARLPWVEGKAGLKDLVLEPEGRGQVLVGIHNFSNGTGGYVRVDAPVTLPMDHMNWEVDGVDRKYGIGKSYGLDMGAFRCSVSSVDRAPIPQAEESSKPRW